MRSGAACIHAPAPGRRAALSLASGRGVPRGWRMAGPSAKVRGVSAAETRPAGGYGSSTESRLIHWIT
jgi:hypothetical protein